MVSAFRIIENKKIFSIYLKLTNELPQSFKPKQQTFAEQSIICAINL